jgi:hypothetical protein
MILSLPLFYYDLLKIFIFGIFLSQNTASCLRVKDTCKNTYNRNPVSHGEVEKYLEKNSGEGRTTKEVGKRMRLKQLSSYCAVNGTRKKGAFF